jgi:uncharacterized protein involved in exopolysaccharide biosynthesis
MILIVGVVTILVYLMPPKYLGSAKLLVERNRAPIMRSNFSPGLEMTEVMNTEIQLVLSRTVMGAVVDELGLANSAAEPTGLSMWLHRFRQSLADLGLVYVSERREAWIKRLLQEVEVEPVVSSNVLTISLLHEDADTAASIVNTIANQYVELHLRVYSLHGISDFYSRQVTTMEHELNRLRDQLSNYKQQTAVSAIREKQGELVRRLGRLQQAKAEALTNIIELSTRYEADHPEVVNSRATASRIEAEIFSANQELSKLESTNSTIDEIELLITAQEESYLTYRRKFEEAKASELSDTDMVNIRLVEYAMVPNRPARNRIFYIFIAVLGSLVISICIAFIREYFDHQVSDPDTAEIILGIPSLGSVEKIGLFSVDTGCTT